MSERASIFDSSAEVEFDVSEFAPKKINPSSPAPPDAVRAIAEEAKFVSREPAKSRESPPIKKEPRRHRTGRNVQVNIKALQDTVDRFNAIVHAQKWVTGYVLERAVAALERELGISGAPGKPLDASRAESGREGQG
jgi:hypothetical protein